MSETTCDCGKPTRDGAYVCETCQTTLARALGEVPWVTEQLDITLTRQRGLPTEGGSRSSTTPLPWHDAASVARHALRNTLTTWVRVCKDDHVRHSSPAAGLPADTLPAMSRWLLWRVDGLALHRAGSEAVTEITDAIANAARIVDRHPDRWYAGPCNATDEDGIECGADLYAKSQRGYVTCRACRSVHDVAARRDWLLAAAEDQLADAATISRAVSWLGAAPLTADRVRKWAERGRIAAKGHDYRGHPLYRIGDAIDQLATDTRKAG